MNGEKGFVVVMCGSSLGVFLSLPRTPFCVQFLIVSAATVIIQLLHYTEYYIYNCNESSTVRFWLGLILGYVWIVVI